MPSARARSVTASSAPPAVQVSEPVLRELHERSGAARWGVTLAVFAARVSLAAAKRFAGTAPAAREIDAFARTLYAEDLALALGCSSGHDGAWDHFVRELRPALYAAGRAIAGDAGRDLADSVLPELYGVDARGEQRRSLLDYYHGRSKLTTWLRTVLSQRHVDEWRSSARTVALEDERTVDAPSRAEVSDPYRTEYVELAQRALNEALAALDSKDRLRLRLYYGQGLKLAKIGRLLSEHEATVSRKLDRTRGDIRREIERQLARHGLSAEAVQECVAQAAGAPELDISRALTADDG
jgi:RNA polymerase sigma factor (sigma-70 family)